MQWFRNLRADKRGTSLIELGLAAPLITVFLLGMVDTSMGIAQKLRNEQAAQRAVEKAIAYGRAGSDFSGIDDEAALAADLPVEQVTFDKWLECDGERAESFTGACDSGEEIARYLSVGIDDAYEPLFAYGPIAKLAGAHHDGSIPLSVYAEVRIQ